MKTINPFKRRNKEDFIPCSLFPASKVCDTSLPLGRAVPVYSLDMVAGNRVSLDVSQLTRFQPMLAPVMTNYSVEFGAFFVPYVAFDEYFTSTWFRQNMQGTDTLRKGVLRAREFFNPAIESSEKVHPWFFSTKRCGDKVNWVGSLYDHLRAPLGLPDWSSDKVYSSDVDGSSVGDKVDDFLSSHILAGSVDLGVVSAILSNKSSIYPYYQLDAVAPWSIGGKPVSQLPFAAWRAGALLDSDAVTYLDGVFARDSVFYETEPGKDVPILSFSGKYYGQHTEDSDFSRISTSSSPSNARDSILVVLHSKLSGCSKVLKDSSTAQSPYRLDFTDYSAVFDVDKLFKRWFTELYSIQLSGTFTLSSGVVTYSPSSSESDGDSSIFGQTSLSSLISSSSYAQVNGFAQKSPAYAVSLSDDISGEFFGFIPFLIDRYNLLPSDNFAWQRSLANLGKTIVEGTSTIYGFAGMAQYFQTPGNNYGDGATFQRVWASICFYVFGFDPSAGRFDSLIPYDDLFGKTTIVQLQQAYRSYVESLWISANRDLSWNSVGWLAYHRIYADWFLNEHYTKHEDYLDLIGSGYLAGYQSLLNSDGKVMTDWFKSGQISDGNNPKLAADSTLSYFGNRIAAGECMPVLWSLDCVTNLIQSTSTSSTPVGQSITENFYNRFYARFKDLINRMGPDYRRNAKALYGKGPDDASLLRSQVVGYRSFDVQIGDVAQNSESTKDSTLGQFAGYAVSRNKAGSFDWTAQESGVFMVLVWVRPKYTCFSDLVPRSLYKKEYMDYLIPQFGGVGYQDFSYKQLCPTSANPESRLGFEERYSEYMMMDNECSGLMRTSLSYYNSNRIGTPCYTPGTADFYHLLYMDEDSDLQRVFVDNVNDPVLISCYFNGNVTRQLPATIKTEF